MLWDSLDGSGIWGRMDTYTCMAESLCCSPEIITTLLIGYTLIRNKKLIIGKTKNRTKNIQRTGFNNGIICSLVNLATEIFFLPLKPILL